MINLIYLIYGVSLLIFIRGVLLEKNIASSLIALNSVNSIIIFLLVLTGCLLKEESFIDIGIVYALLGYIANVGFMKKYGKTKNE